MCYVVPTQESPIFQISISGLSQISVTLSQTSSLTRRTEGLSLVGQIPIHEPVRDGTRWKGLKEGMEMPHCHCVPQGGIRYTQCLVLHDTYCLCDSPDYWNLTLESKWAKHASDVRRLPDSK